MTHSLCVLGWVFVSWNVF